MNRVTKKIKPNAEENPSAILLSPVGAIASQDNSKNSVQPTGDILLRIDVRKLIAKKERLKEKHKRFILNHPHYSRERNPIKKRLYKKINNAHRKKVGTVLLKTLQKLYEDNIKKFGTLTCIYCLQPIPFGKDSLEHKQPISKGGTNEYSNLAVACFKCNHLKNNKTEQEFFLVKTKQ